MTLPLFAVLSHYEVPIAFAFFIWVGIYGVMVGVADVGLRGRLVQRQERPAPVRGDHAGRQPGRARRLQAHGTGGGRAVAHGAHDPRDLHARRHAVPRQSRTRRDPGRIARGRDRTLPARAASCSAASAWCCATATCCTIALFVVLLNWINTRANSSLPISSKADAVARVAESGGTLDLGSLITEFYGNFNFWVTLISLASSCSWFRASTRLVGVRGALLVHPIIVAAGIWPAGARADDRRVHSDLLADPPDQVCRERPRLLADEHHAAGVVPAGRPRLEIRRQDGDRHVLLALRRPHPGRRRYTSGSICWTGKRTSSRC